MLDEEINNTIKELADLLNPKALLKVHSHINSLMILMEKLRKSRDKWKNKALNSS